VETAHTEIPVDAVVFRQDLYPRLKHNPVLVQRYAQDLSVLPPIELNQDRILIDGWNRWTAHKSEKAETIKVITTHTESDAQLLDLAVERNASHGEQLDRSDKKALSLRMYAATPSDLRKGKKEHLCKLFSVSASTMADWCSDLDTVEREARLKRIYDAWLACDTQEVIAEREGIGRKTVDDYVQGFGGFSGSGIFAKNAAALAVFQDGVDDEGDERWPVPIYNVWSTSKKTNKVSHFGNTEKRWLENLLYSYTDPFDIVVDPFAGGGSTIDVCKKRFRRYLVSDRAPIMARASEIRKHDLLDGPLKPSQWKDVKLVFLDPPYWWQAKGKYSEDPTDLANMSLKDFNAALSGIINGYADKLSCGAHIALIIQPTQWVAPERQFTDHVGDMLKLANKDMLIVDMRFSAPYSTEQYNAQQVNWAKENKRCLVLTREIIVWKVVK